MVALSGELQMPLIAGAIMDAPFELLELVALVSGLPDEEPEPLNRYRNIHADGADGD